MQGNTIESAAEPNKPSGSPQEIASSCEVSSGSKMLGPNSVWNHFTKIIPPSGSKITKRKCNYCNGEFSCVSSSGTSGLRRHLDRCYKYPASQKDKKQKLLHLTVEENDGQNFASLSSWKFDQEICRREVASMVIMDELPFKFVEREGFRRLLRALQPRFNLLSRTTVTKDCFALYLEEKQKLKDVFMKNSYRVCITTDMWTSIQNLSYMCVTAHYIDLDWKLQKRIINFSIVPSPHTGEMICNVLESCLLDWGLEKLCTITVDNASNNDVAVRNLKRRLIKKNGLLLNGEYFHVRCCAHILNLIVKSGLEVCGDSIAKIRSIVRYVRSSPARSQQFKLCCEHEKIQCKRSLCLDVPTRWNSTYLMLTTVLEFQKAFECLEDRDLSFAMDCKELVPNEQDWKKAKMLCNFLEVFYNATTRLSGSHYITSNFYFYEFYAIESLLVEWSRSEDPICFDMAIAMMDKFRKYWDSAEKINIFLIVAIVLDPRFKLAHVEACYLEMYTQCDVEMKIGEIKNVMNQLYNFYQSFELPLNAIEARQATSTSKSTDLPKNFAKDVHQKILQKRKNKVNLLVGNELDQYLLENIVDDGDSFDILDWWKMNASRFPILSKMVRDILAIPVSTVASELAFSTGGRILDQFRSSLTPRIVEALVCTQDWLRQAPLFYNIEENLDDLEKIVTDFKDITVTSLN